MSDNGTVVIGEPLEAAASDVGTVQARRLVDLIRSGVPASEASEKIGLPAPGLRSPEIQKQIQDLLRDTYLPADVQRATLRAGRFKAFLQMLEAGFGGDMAAMKMAAEFSKQIGMDPEVGLNQAPQTTVNIDIGELRGVLDKIGSVEEIIVEDFNNEEAET